MQDRQAAVMSPARRVWALTAVLAVAAAALVLHTRFVTAPLPQATPLGWIAVTVGFAAAEIWVVHLQFRREVNTVSLAEVPLTLGLIFLAPRELIAAQVLGTATVLVFHRRQSLVKLAFNLVQLTFCTGVGVLVFHALMGSAEPLKPTWWIAALAATGSAALLSVLTVSAAISLTEGRLTMSKLGPVIAFSIGGACVNTSLALVGAVTMYRDARAGVLLLMPAVTLYAAYRAYTRERQKTERIEFLYNSGRTLAGAPAGESAIVELLGEALTMFRAEVAQISVWSSPGRVAVRTTVRDSGVLEVNQPVDRLASDALLEDIMASQSGRVISRRGARDAELAFLVAHRMTDAVVTSLRAENRVVGTILVGKFQGDVIGFDGEHLNLLETLAAQVGAAVENSRLEKVLHHQAFHDALTNLPNRALLNSKLEAALSRPDARLAVLLVDVDDFKVVNDTLGHSVGDEVLVGVAERLTGAIRSADTAARIGGDEFAVLVEDIASAADATATAHRVIQAFKAPFALGGQQVRVGASIGIATNMNELLDPGALVLQADVAMYAAKAQEPGNYRVFEASMQDEVTERHALREDLRLALERGEMVNYYQPLVSLDGPGVLGAEALVRWRHAERGLVAPGYFIQLAEESGLIVELGRWVLREACRQLKHWQRTIPGTGSMGISVNLSAVQLRQPGFVDDVVSILKETDLDAGALTLEITESTFMDDTRAAIARLRELRGLGIRLELDDFGTGYSSLSVLRDLPLDGLKIDKSFVDVIQDPADRPAFLQAIVRLAEALDLEMVGEGIEHRHQADALRAMGCTRGQGYMFARPLPAEEMGVYLARSLEWPLGEGSAVVALPTRRRSD
ncbi:MAG: hypothetical protein NVS3B24_09010 [Candidatus Dormibacteria bacterium]